MLLCEGFEGANAQVGLQCLLIPEYRSRELILPLYGRAQDFVFADTFEISLDDLEEVDYAALHDAGDNALQTRLDGVFRIDRVGQGDAPYDDRGIEYYEYTV